ncbi:MAG TPA: folylpolyglutamate synthase/dihydrofolate synthase family protein [Bacteroidales bacterium]|nr:folylpolyglutamate synthase/dihydrofolate synthase family protein [Bacteroidales bacterium]HPT21884.1 folylpolyglutamate synthase/dihydrofolate synthase family protein [Bacteroidales bacterium]
MNYEETLKYLFAQLPAYHRLGKAAYKDNLDNTIALDNHLGNPHLNYRTIHIAGTNGKGSVSHMIASVLQEAGYLTGLYTSPHLKDFRERIKVNGEMIPEDEVVKFVEKNRNIIESLEPSFFEMTVAMAFKYFEKRRVDVAVIEVGLGGRLDSTNIINPVLSVITNIGHDHMDLLGNTFAMVASEKAGIIKKSVPVVISETHPETEEIFISKATATGSFISFSDKRFSCTLEESDIMKGERKYMIVDHKTNSEYEGITALGGDYQGKNLKAVFDAVDNLHGVFRITEDNIKNGIRNVIKNTGLMGRWQILSYNPLIICDTGHNKEGLEYVTDQLRRVQKTRLHIILGFVKDKDLKLVLPLFPKEATYYFTKAPIPRALDEILLKENAEKFGLSGECYPDVKTALTAARKNAVESDIIFIGGSTFVVAEVV